MTSIMKCGHPEYSPCKEDHCSNATCYNCCGEARHITPETVTLLPARPPVRLTGDELKTSIGSPSPIFNGQLISLSVCPKCYTALMGAQAGRFHFCDGYILARDVDTQSYYRAYCECPCDS